MNNQSAGFANRLREVFTVLRTAFQGSVNMRVLAFIMQNLDFGRKFARRRKVRRCSNSDALESRRLLSAIRFADVTAESGIPQYQDFVMSAAWTDVNRDGFQDLWLGPHTPEFGFGGSAEWNPPLLLINSGNGTFLNDYEAAFSDNAVRDNHGASWIDADNDGDADLLQMVGGANGLAEDSELTSNRLFMNDGGIFSDETRNGGPGAPVGRGYDAEWLDADLDGRADVFLINELRFDGMSPSRLIPQQADGWDSSQSLTEISQDPVKSAQLQDLNADLRPDILLRTGTDSLRILLSTGDPEAPYVNGNSLLKGIDLPQGIRDIALGDFNGDLYTDIVLITTGSIDTLLLYDPAVGQFRNATEDSGMQFSWGTQVVAADLDNDGDLDLYVGCELSNTDLPDLIYQNNGAAVFTPISGDPGATPTQMDFSVGTKVLSSDFDNDGFLDLFLGGTGANAAPNRLLRNLGNQNHWLKIILEGVQSTRQALGARVEVATGAMSQVRQQASGKHRFSQDDSRLHFGLGAASIAESITVYWPSGKVTTLTNIDADQILRISEPAAASMDLSRPVSVRSAAADYSGVLSTAQPVQWFQFEVATSGTLQTRLAGEHTGVRVTDENDSTIATWTTQNGIVDGQIELTAGKWFLEVRLAEAAQSSEFLLSPAFTPQHDDRGPVVEDVAVDRTLSSGGISVVAVVNDASRGSGSVAGAEYFLNSPGVPGTGNPLLPVDGTWSDSGELVSGIIPHAVCDSLSPGTQTVYVHAMDLHGNWGDFKSVTFQRLESSPPEIELNAAAIDILSGTPALRLLPFASYLDADSPLAANATITVRLEEAASSYMLSLEVDDRFSVQADGAIRIDGISAGHLWTVNSNVQISHRTLRVRLNDQATSRTIQEILKRVLLRLHREYRYPDNPLSTALTIRIEDGAGGLSERSISVHFVHSELRFDISGVWTEGTAAASIVPDATWATQSPAVLPAASLVVHFPLQNEPFDSGYASGDFLEISSNAIESVRVTGNTVLVDEQITGSFSGGAAGIPLSVSLNSNASPAQLLKLIRSVRFGSTAAAFATSSRVISFRLNRPDGSIIAAAFASVSIIPVNDAPVLNVADGLYEYREHARPVFLFPRIIVSDSDSQNMGAARLHVQFNNGDHVNDRLTLQNQGAGVNQVLVADLRVYVGGIFTAQFSGGAIGQPLVVEFQGAASRTRVQAVLRSVAFFSPGDQPPRGKRTVALRLEDGDGGVSSNVTCETDVLSLALSPAVIPENQPIGTIVGQLSMMENEPADRFSYVLISGEGSEWNSAFSLQATGLLSAARVFDFEQQSLFPIRIRISDTAGFSVEQQLVIALEDVNESPSAIGLQRLVTSMQETTGTLAPVRIADIAVTDDAIGSNLLTVSGRDAEYFQITDGQLFLRAGTILNASLKSEYQYRVEVADLSLSSTRSVDGSLTVLTKTPEILSPSASTASMRPTLMWTSSPFAIRYEITLREQVSGPTTSKIVVVTDGSINIRLANFEVSGALYTPPSDLGIGRFIYWVRAVGSTGLKSAWSSPCIFDITAAVTINPLPSVRQLVTRPTISWQPLPGAERYDVWIDNRTVLPAVSQYVRTEVTSASWTHPSSLPMGRYRIRVRGVDEKHLYRNWSTFTDFVVAPSPGIVKITSTFDRTPTFAWSDITGANSYEIVVRHRLTGNEVFRQTTTQTHATPSFNLAMGDYNWQVRAIGAGGYSSNFTEKSSIFIGGRPVAQPIVVNNRIPILSWLDVQGAAYYQVRVDRLDVPTTNVINRTGLAVTQYTHTGPLLPGTYRFWVRAISQSSAEVSLFSHGLDFNVAMDQPESNADRIAVLSNFRTDFPGEEHSPTEQLVKTYEGEQANRPAATADRTEGCDKRQMPRFHIQTGRRIC